MKKAISLAIAVVLMFLFVSSTHSQDEPPQVNTMFSATCIEALGETHYRIHFGYDSDGVETYLFTIGSIEGSNSEVPPYNGNATTNVPMSFTTKVGSHYDWYLDAHSEDSPYTFHMVFTNLTGYADMPLSTWDFPFPDAWCNNGEYSTPVSGSPIEPTSEFVPHPTLDPIYYTPTPTIIPPEDRVYWAYVWGNGRYYWSKVNEAGAILDLPPVK